MVEEFVKKGALEVAASGLDTTNSLVTRLLGPTADYLGNELKNYVQKRRENAQRILEKADRKIEENALSPGGINPRIVKETIDEGSWNDTELAAEYFGGVLASSYSGVSRDDRGAIYARLVTNMTSYQLAAHYYFYTVLRNWFRNRPTLGNKLQSEYYRGIWIHPSSLILYLGLYENENADDILADIMTGLLCHDLVGDSSGGADVKTLQLHWPDVENDGIVVAPSYRGIMLYMFALGLGHMTDRDYFSPDLELPLPIMFPVFDSLKPVGLMQSIY